ncbi:hypothetical protein ACFX13_047862 [Malus domestica]|uniref:uncharacterized protein n=1 Tax=Malus domestica TaxID=3750 RepID=UPI0004987C17
MSQDIYFERPLFGGAITSTFHLRFEDVSNSRQVPDHQEALVDPAQDESLIFELLELKHEVDDNGSANWFLQDLATEQDADGSMVIEQSGVIEAPRLYYRNTPAVVMNGGSSANARKVCTLELFSAKRLEDLKPIRKDKVTAMVESIFNHYTKLDETPP